MAAQQSLFDILLDHLSESGLDGTADLLIIADTLPALLHDDGKVQLIPGTAATPRRLLEDAITAEWDLWVALNTPYDVTYKHEGVNYHAVVHNGGDNLLSVTFHQIDVVQSEPSKIIRSLRNRRPEPGVKQ